MAAAERRDRNCSSRSRSRSRRIARFPQIFIVEFRAAELHLTLLEITFAFVNFASISLIPRVTECLRSPRGPRRALCSDTSLREFRPVIEFYLAGIVSPSNLLCHIYRAHFSICCAPLVACIQRDLSETQPAAQRVCSISRCVAAGSSAAIVRPSQPAASQAVETAAARPKPRALPPATARSPEEPPPFSSPPAQAAAASAADGDDSDADLSRLLEALVLSYLFPRFVDRVLDSREQLMQPAYLVPVPACHAQLTVDSSRELNTELNLLQSIRALCCLCLCSRSTWTRAAS